MEKFDLNECFNVLKNVNKVFLAFNSNIDCIKQLNPSLEKIAKKFNPKPLIVKELLTPFDLFSGLLFSLKFGEAIEIGMHSKLEEWLKKNLTYGKLRMGGQTGIMANNLAFFGITPIVFTPLLSLKQKMLFNKKTIFLNKTLKKWVEVNRNDPKKINWIFEFSKGQTFLGFKAKRTTRFIASSRREDFKMKKLSLNFDFDAAILSGFHSIKEKYSDGTTFKQQFKIARDTAIQIKEKEKPLHQEFGFSPFKKITLEMLKLSSFCDSIGLDEQDLINCLQAINHERLAKKIHLNHNIKDIFKGLKIILKSFKPKKIHLHGRGFFLSLCRKEHFLMPEEIWKSMHFASIVAASRASFKLKNKKDVWNGFKISVSRKGIKKRKELALYLNADKKEELTGIFSRKNFDVILVPNRVAKKVLNVVGLGDIISSSIFACETGFLLSKKIFTV
jgi:ADP-dependent phosphofructokinase/glucokinase